MWWWRYPWSSTSSVTQFNTERFLNSSMNTQNILPTNLSVDTSNVSSSMNTKIENSPILSDLNRSGALETRFSSSAPTPPWKTDEIPTAGPSSFENAEILSSNQTTPRQSPLNIPDSRNESSTK